MLTHNRNFTWLDLYLQNLTGLFEHDKESLIARYSSNPSNDSHVPSLDKPHPITTPLPRMEKNSVHKVQ